MEISVNCLDIIYEILKNISDPSTFLNAIRINKDWYNEGKRLIQDKKKQFTRQRKRFLFIDNTRYIEYIDEYPNRMKNGKDIIYYIGSRNNELKDIARERNWKEGKLDGMETTYDNKGNLTYQVNWVNNKKEGESYEYLYKRNNLKLNFPDLLITHWRNNNKIMRERLTYYGDTIERDYYNLKEKNIFIRDTNSGYSLKRTGIFINDKKHGVFNEFGRNNLYMHGIFQPWYTKDKNEIFSYIFIILITITFILSIYFGNRSLFVFSILGFYLYILFAPLVYGFMNGFRYKFMNS